MNCVVGWRLQGKSNYVDRHSGLHRHRIGKICGVRMASVGRLVGNLKGDDKFKIQLRSEHPIDICMDRRFWISTLRLRIY